MKRQTNRSPVSQSKTQKIVVVFACVFLLLMGLLFEYRKYQAKPFSHIIPLSRDEIVKAALNYSSGYRATMEPEQIAAFFDAVDNCSVKFWSASTNGLSNFYADVFLYTDDPFSNAYVDIMFSTDGRVAITPRQSHYLTVYKFVDGGDAVYQFLKDRGAVSEKQGDDSSVLTNRPTKGGVPCTPPFSFGPPPLFSTCKQGKKLV